MKKKKPRPRISNKFKEAVESTPDIKECYQTGLQAMGAYSSKVELSDNRECNGSLDIDNCIRKNYPTSNRWDYAFSYKSVAYFVEVHSAETNEVSTVLAKLQWLKDWLKSSAPELLKLKAKKTPYYWIQSGRFNILKNSRQYRQAAQNGILPISKLYL